MCGILGGINRSASISHSGIAAALATMGHRGPDAEGIYENATAFLGHRRLSIIDLDPRANQPLRVGSLVISYNGEIYNYRAVRQSLERLGVSFSTESDTEVIVAAFRHEGLRCLERFEGMFAFAIWDEATRMLTLARDRFGEKPLYYFQDHGLFLFASEIPPLEMLIGRDRLEVDQDAISLYFQFSFIPAPRAPYVGMRQLEPGTWMQFDANTWSHRSEKYHALRLRPRAISMEDAVEELRQRLTDSVKLRLSAADVPVATFLSGGIDSSIISALAAVGSTQEVRAYSIGFSEDPGFDESPYARLVAQRYPEIHHTVVDATERTLLDFTDRTLSGLGEPYADASIIPTAFLCAHVEEKVILGGDAADELFAGYGVYAAMRASARIPAWLKRIALALPAPRNPNAIRNPQLRAAALFLGHLGETPLDEYMSWRTYVSPQQISALGIPLAGDVRTTVGTHRLDTLSDLLALDIRFNLPNDMLKKVDLASMQHSLEVRLPYLDYHLTEFALSLPEEFLIGDGERKRILRTAFRDLLPEQIFTRRKQGFLLPIRRWFKSGRMREELLALAERSAMLDLGVLRRFVLEHETGRYDHSVLLWTCFVFLKWHGRLRH